jgi:hypothetical protein
MEYIDAAKSGIIKGLRNSPRQILSSALNVSGYGNSSFISNNIKEYRNSATKNLMQEMRRSPSPFSTQRSASPSSPIYIYKPMPHYLTKQHINMTRKVNKFQSNILKRNRNKTRNNRRNSLNYGSFKPIPQLV